MFSVTYGSDSDNSVRTFVASDPPIFVNVTYISAVSPGSRILLLPNHYLITVKDTENIIELLNNFE